MQIKPITPHQAGFTLLEVMIATMILAVISLSVYQATTQTYRVRERLVQDGDFYNGIRLAMNVLDTDIMSLFSPIAFKNDPNLPTANAQANAANARNSNSADGVSNDNTADNSVNAGNNRNRRNRTQALTPQDQEKLNLLKESDLGQLSNYWMPANDLTAVRLSRFTGDENKLQFVTASHRRLYKGSPESEFSKVTYELREDPNPDKIAGTKILMKIENPVFMDDRNFREKTEKSYSLLTGVKSIKFRYFRMDKRAWERKWDTSQDDMINRYPDLVEATVEVVGQSDRKLEFQGTYIMKPEMIFYAIESTF